MDTSVLVVGGGPVGLAMAGHLGRFGVDAVLVERRTGPDPHPRARSINVRTNEILRAWGIEEEVRSVCLPDEWSQQMVFTTTLAGREIGRVPMLTQGTRDGVEHAQDRLQAVLGRQLPGAPTRSAASTPRRRRSCTGSCLDFHILSVYILSM
jgi:2-polyprenyl-6-methoxyphenol hydroxylase-like FAD-dependent oxidoreductase